MKEMTKSCTRVVLLSFLLIGSSTPTTATEPHLSAPCIQEGTAAPPPHGQQILSWQSKQESDKKEAISTRRFVMAVLAAILKHREPLQHPAPTPLDEVIERQSPENRGKKGLQPPSSLSNP